MAKITSGILTNISGSIGYLNFYKWKDQQIIRAKRGSSKKPPTEAQILSREKFKLLGQLFSALKESSQIGFKSCNSSMSEQNAFIKSNYSSLITNGERLIISYPKIILSAGEDNGLQSLQARVDDSNFYFTWKNSSPPNHLDKTYSILLCIQDFYLQILSESLTKSENARIEIPSEWKGKTFHAYTFNKTQKDVVSASKYLGEFVV